MPSGPRHVAQPHQGDPPQAAGLDQLAPAGTHRVAVDAPTFDLGAATPFQGFVDAGDQRPVAVIQMAEQQQQLSLLPGWVGEQRCEGNENSYNGSGQGEHGWAFSDIGVRPVTGYPVLLLF